MAAISETIFSDAFSWMKYFYFDSNLTELYCECPIDNKPALAQIMAWRRIGPRACASFLHYWFLYVKYTIVLFSQTDIDAKIDVLLCEPELAVEQTIGLPMIWDTINAMRHHDAHCNKDIGTEFVHIISGRAMRLVGHL